MTFDHSVFTHCSHVSDSTYICTANSIPGNITPTFDPSGRLTLSSIFCIPKLIIQLLSIGKITDCKYNILFTPNSFIVQDHTGRKIVTGCKINDLYQLKYLHLPSSPHPVMSLSVTSDLWHRCLGHLSSFRLKTLFDFDLFGKFLVF